MKVPSDAKPDGGGVRRSACAPRAVPSGGLISRLACVQPADGALNIPRCLPSLSAKAVVRADMSVGRVCAIRVQERTRCAHIEFFGSWTRERVPAANRVAVLVNPAGPAPETTLLRIAHAGSSMSISDEPMSEEEWSKRYGTPH